MKAIGKMEKKMVKDWRSRQINQNMKERLKKERSTDLEQSNILIIKYTKENS